MFLPQNRWSGCFDSKLQAGWKSCYTFENQCNQSDTHEWEVKLTFQHRNDPSLVVWGRSIGWHSLT
jgi:hypothetical protein